MNQFFKILLLLVLVILVAIFYYEKTSVDQDQPIAGTTDESEHQTIKTDAVDTRAESTLVMMLSDEVATSLFDSAADAGKSMQVIERLFAQGKDELARALLKELEGRCGFKDQIAPMPSTQDWVFEKVKSYCDNYDSSLFNQLYKEGARFNSLNPDVLALTRSDETDINRLSEDFLKMLTEMRHPSMSFMADVSQTVDFFISDMAVPLELGQSDSRVFSIGTIQRVAIRMYACGRFGGCGSDSYQLLSKCFIDSRCQPDWSLVDYYQNTLAPADFNEVMNILDTIRRYEGGNP